MGVYGGLWWSMGVILCHFTSFIRGTGNATEAVRHNLIFISNLGRVGTLDRGLVEGPKGALSSLVIILGNNCDFLGMGILGMRGWFTSPSESR